MKKCCVCDTSDAVKLFMGLAENYPLCTDCWDMEPSFSGTGDAFHRTMAYLGDMMDEGKKSQITEAKRLVGV